MRVPVNLFTLRSLANTDDLREYLRAGAHIFVSGIGMLTKIEAAQATGLAK